MTWKFRTRWPSERENIEISVEVERRRTFKESRRILKGASQISRRHAIKRRDLHRIAKVVCINSYQHHAALRKASICLSHSLTSFQLANVRVAIHLATSSRSR